jgi:hypothetical protein
VERDNWKLFLWVTMKFPMLSRDERIEVLKGILLYMQFCEHVGEWVRA